MSKTLEKPTKRKAAANKASRLLRQAMVRQRAHSRPLTPDREEEILASIKKTREELWDRHIASRPRR